jgi:hypothetical protein
MRITLRQVHTRLPPNPQWLVSFVSVVVVLVQEAQAVAMGVVVVVLVILITTQ